MIYIKSTKYVVNAEKLKVFLDYLHVFVKKGRMELHNLSLEYGLINENEIILTERWSSQQDLKNFEKRDEIKVELETLAKMASQTLVLFALETVK
ncbi:antibiotic biosynthesis monooxygenase [Mycoplasma sp. Ms02]|uniref:antibiotic biosynthesis monooxygenase n=1 Tax=Mycoplasma sp. Ms02 TaxID=353851 RepID=UPI001C88E48C|nr:antibiotic biosynthesis monooxygenase [Mycoplasma sp. Ms02]QZE12276.1 antibiotic biosynthesis monooxygenase [Mycoplasma sp. Ms02]